MPPSLEQFPAREGGVATSRSNKVWQPKSGEKSAVVRLYLVPPGVTEASCPQIIHSDTIVEVGVSNEPVSQW